MKTKQKVKPLYTKGEEIFNAVSHIVGGAFAIIATTLMLFLSIGSGKAVLIICSLIYGISMILMFTISSIYHFLRTNKAKRVFRILDHCSIFFLIAGTYTPFCLISLTNSAWGIVLFSIVWIFAILGIVLNGVNMHNKKVAVFSQICYIALGWCVIFVVFPLIQSVELMGLLWLSIGGVMYTVGAVFYAFGKKAKYIHSVWHLFVLLGCIFQFISVYLYVIKPAI